MLKREFTTEELDRARQLQADGMSWKKMGPQVFGCAGSTIRGALDDEFRKRTRAEEKKRVQARRRDWVAGVLVRVDPLEPMQKLLEVQPIPTTLDQIYFGDPLPGRSALDQQRGVSE